MYRRNGVREYLLWRILDKDFDWFVLRDGEYHRLTPADDGLLRSESFPGLWLDVAALVRGELATVLSILQRGLASSEHAEFVSRLGGRTSS